MEQITLKAQARCANGSGEARRTRRQGRIPAAIMKPHGETLPISIDAHEFELAVRGHKGGQLLIKLDLDGSPTDVLLRERQNHVLTGKPDHLDFSQVNLTDRTRITIQIRLVGDPEGVRVGGGILTQPLRAIEVDAQIKDLVEVLDLDVSHLKLGETLFVKDLQFGDKFHIHNRADLPVASVAAPEEEAAAAEGDGKPDVEVITKGKKEDAAAGAAPAAKKGK